MNSIQEVLDMVCTDALEGGPNVHYFDEFRNREFIPRKPEISLGVKKSVPLEKYDIGLVREEYGNLRWSR